MAGAALSIKLRCASWQQLATIYRRDLSRGTMFLKATTQPEVGTTVNIDLELPSASVIQLVGKIVKHVSDPSRGTGVELALEPLPTKSVWMIESALAAENQVRAQHADSAAEHTPPPARPSTLSDGEEVAAAELELIRALEAEAESLRKLNPFLVLGVGYETNDEDVRRAFGELTKRYHPDRFVRYQSLQLRQLAAEIFILIRDAYRKLADDKARQLVISTLRPRAQPRAQSEPRAAPQAKTTTSVVRVAVPPPKTVEVAKVPGPEMMPQDRPTNPSGKSAELAMTELARGGDALAIPIAPAPVDNRPGVPTDKLPASPTKRTVSPVPEPIDASAIEALLDQGKLDEAMSQYRALAKKHPQDRGLRAGIELCEGLKATLQRDRLEAAQRFEAALELDPSNERAARELADMRRQATNERKGLLSRLMGKKEPPP